ncbi:hypothetical protein ABEB36_007607 [Hypothenemus hampei]|uniref:Uncharacterized protein n=1 Tax=Hypothenemus hampei TaxID=57062 RepID=A0ABD1EUP2_HYPHA
MIKTLVIILVLCAFAYGKPANAYLPPYPKGPSPAPPSTAVRNVSANIRDLLNTLGFGGSCAHCINPNAINSNNL